MIVIAVGIIVFILVMVFFWHVDAPVFGFFAAVFLGVGIAYAVSTAGFYIGSESENQVVAEPDTIRLESVGSGQGVSGDFFLGTGYVSGSRVVNYVVKDETGGKVLRSVSANKSVIYEDTTRESARLDYSVVTWHNGWFSPATYDLGKVYKFHVPEGTVSTDFEVGN